MAYPDTTLLSSKFSTDGGSAPREQPQSNKTQWLPARAISRHQSRETWLCHCNDFLQHFPQHDALTSS